MKFEIEWINFKEKKPDREDNYIVMNELGMIYVRKYWVNRIRWDFKKQCNVIESYFNNAVSREITHWAKIDKTIVYV